MQIAGTFLEIRPNILDLCVLCYQFFPVPVQLLLTSYIFLAWLIVETQNQLQSQFQDSSQRFGQYCGLLPSTCVILGGVLKSLGAPIESHHSSIEASSEVVSPSLSGASLSFSEVNKATKLCSPSSRMLWRQVPEAGDDYLGKSYFTNLKKCQKKA